MTSEFKHSVNSVDICARCGSSRSPNPTIFVLQAMDVEAVDLARLARGERLERADERSLFSASDSDGTQRGHRKHKRRTRSRTTKPKRRSRSKSRPRSSRQRQSKRSMESRKHRSRSERRKESAPATSATSPKTRGKTRPRESRVEQHEHNENMDVSPEKQLAILNEMENEIVRMRESINLAVCHIMPDVKKLMARVKLAENALNNLKMFAEDAKNLPTLLRTLQAGTNRLQSLEEQYQDARASSSVLRSPFLPPRHNE